jgi:hypothetical protein
VVLVRFEVLTETNIKIATFWGVASCDLVDTDRRFGGACCLHHADWS